MDRTRSTPFVHLTVKCALREDGGLRVYSDDVPELVLSHRDARAVLNDIEPALEIILSAKLGYPVRVEPLTPLNEVLEKASAISGSSEPETDDTDAMPAHLCDRLRNYVAHCN